MVRTASDIVDSLFSNAIQKELMPSKFIRGRLGISFAVLASEIESWEVTIQNYQKDNNLLTATDEDAIENLAAPFHTRLQATYSEVTLKIYRDDVTKEQYISEGTGVKNSNSPAIQYTTAKDATLYVGEEFIYVRAQAVLPGTSQNVLPGELVHFIDNLAYSGLKVTNEQASWGGTDKEAIEDVRVSALGARYEMEKGTEYALRQALREYGLEDYQYNLKEFTFGNGTASLYIATELDEVVDELQTVIDGQKGFGIYVVIQKATKIPFNFKFKIGVSSLTDILPRDRIVLTSKLEAAFKEYVETNGVGKELVLSKAVHEIYAELLEEFDLYDIHLSTDDNLDKQDDKGNIVLNNDEVIQIDSVVINIETG